MLSTTIRLAFLLFPVCLAAQTHLSIPLPELQITADRLVRGDADTYGLGDWRCEVSVRLEGADFVLTANISFTEKANDFTTLVGSTTQRIHVGELERCQHCNIALDNTTGQVNGPNIGARGYRWFDGTGLVRRAWIQTDTFGADTGHVGGTVQLGAVQVLVHCDFAE